MQTVAILIAMFMVAWAIRGDIANNAVGIEKNAAAIEKNAAAIAEMRIVIADMRIIIADMRNDVSELRGALLAHVGRHNHPPTVALQDSPAETQ